VQVIETTTDHNVPEVQLLYIDTTFNGSTTYEIQQVICDATGGTFRLTFLGQTTPPIAYNADEATISASLLQLSSIELVNVTFVGITQACSSVRSTGFLVTFLSVSGRTGDLPLMSAYTNSLGGLRYVSISEVVKGSAGIGGSYRLSFRGSMTEDIPAATTTAEVMRKYLEALDSIPFGGVSVTLVPASELISPYSMLYRITFTSEELGGDLEAIKVCRVA
jgi:hypothetical protein